MKEFRTIPTDNVLNISINSFGGAVYTALSIYSLLKTHKGQINIRVDGTAMSAATIITSTPNAKVIMPKGSMMMIHKVSSVAIGTADDMRKEANVMEQLEENIINIYAEKTGKSADEIREKVNAETFFTAEEAVEFGLADELDESRTVENFAAGDYVMVNGLEVQAKFFERAPKGFIKADTPKATAINKNPEKTEVKKMDLQTLKAEHPDLVEAIRAEALAEGAQNERARIQAIEEIAVAGHENLVNAAKFDGVTTAEALAVQMIKAEKARNGQMLKKYQDDAKDLEGLGDQGNKGIDMKADAKKTAHAQKVSNLKNLCKFDGGNE